MDIERIKNIVWETVDFKYDGKIETSKSNELSVAFDGKTAKIGYDTISSLCRAFFLFAKNFKKGNFEIHEKAHFETCGCMVDMSRNGVMTVSAVKKYINYMASIGLNMLMLYTEDTYEIKDYPYFGYMRGRYSMEELKEIDSYADSLGIEVIPCIQTLGHMEQFLKYKVNEKVRDTKDILLVLSDDTYKFIETEIKTVSEAFKSKRIHIGMDEAHDIGLGQFLDKNGFHNRYDILLEHLQKVYAICKKYDYEPMMWNDMFFRMSAPNKDYYNYKETNFSDEIKKSVPDIDMVYWDYYHGDKQTYFEMMKKSDEIGRRTVFAGGISVWYGFLPLANGTIENSISAMQACLENKTKDVFATLWGDDGTEANYFLAVPYLPLFSEYCYKGTKCTQKDIEETSEFLTKFPFETTKNIGKFCHTFEDGYTAFGKRLFYSDIMYDIGFFKERCDETIKLYEDALKDIEDKLNLKDKNYDWYLYSKLLFSIVIKKAALMRDFRTKYKNGDKEYIKNVLENILPVLKEEYIKLKKVHKSQWKTTFKPFGFEVLSNRYGAISSRIDDWVETLTDYLNGKTAKIDELEEEYLPTDEGYYNQAKNILTPSSIN